MTATLGVRSLSRRGFLGQFAGAGCVGLISGLGSAAAGIAVSPDRQVDALVAEAMESQRIAGLSVAVVSRGVILKEAGYGSADIERNAFMRPDTVLRIASISKQFIASAIMLLVEGNQVSLDDAITTYLHNPPVAWRRISVRQLLTHTSGLVREAPGYDPRQMVSDARIIASGYDVPLQSHPGDRWSYSNLGYWILAEIISVASGMHWTNFIHDRIFRAVGMRDTLPTTAVARGRIVAKGYRWPGNGMRCATLLLCDRAELSCRPCSTSPNGMPHSTAIRSCPEPRAPKCGPLGPSTMATGSTMASDGSCGRRTAGSSYTMAGRTQASSPILFATSMRD
jgi:CubicO group peptidase (beta-lactamase class C family)